MRCFGAELSEPDNNEMQRARLGKDEASPLITVLGRPTTKVERSVLNRRVPIL